MNRGLLGLGFRVTADALARRGAEGRHPLRCKGLFDAGWLAYFMGRYAEAREYLQESLQIARENGDARAIAVTLQPLGMACLGSGDVSAAEVFLEEGVELARQSGSKRELAAALNSLGQSHRAAARPETAEPQFVAALALGREIGDREYVAVFLLNLSMVAVGRTPAAMIRTMLLEVLGIAAEIGSKPAAQGAVEACSGLAAEEGDWHRAARWFGVAESHAVVTGLQRDPADEAFLAAHVGRARQALGAPLFLQVEAEGRALPHPRALDEVTGWLTGAAPPA